MVTKSNPPDIGSPSRKCSLNTNPVDGTANVAAGIMIAGVLELSSIRANHVVPASLTDITSCLRTIVVAQIGMVPPAAILFLLVTITFWETLRIVPADTPNEFLVVP